MPNGLLDPGGAFGDNPYQLPAAPITTAPAPTGVVIGPFAASYAPGPNSAFTVTPGSWLDGIVGGTFLPGATTFGPYPAMVTLANGQYSLTGTATDTIPFGPVSLQPGDWPQPQTDPATFAPTAGAAVNGTLGPPVAAAVPPSADIAYSLGPVQTSVFDDGSCTLLAGADAYIHVSLAGTNADGTAVVIAGLAASLAAAGTPLQMALWPDYGPPPAFQPAGVLTTPSTPSTPAASFVRLLISAAGNNLPPPGAYCVMVQIGTQEVLAQNVLVVYGSDPASLLPSSDSGAGIAITEPGFDGGG